VSSLGRWEEISKEEEGKGLWVGFLQHNSKYHYKHYNKHHTSTTRRRQGSWDS
jgi:hypothetical protein